MAAVISHDRVVPVDMIDLGASAEHWTRRIPVSVNDTYGDPFIPEQIANTCAKLDALARHEFPIAIFTKAGYDDGVLHRLADVADRRNVVVYYSLTALDEGGIGFAERLRFIEALTGLFTNTFVFTRPIIRGRNDDPATLRRLSRAAADLTGRLVLGGLHDAKKRKNIEFSVEQQLIEFCDALGVVTFHKTSCAAAWCHSLECWVHDLGKPRELAVVDRLRYEYDLVQGRVVLHRGTTGDLNFLRMVTRSDVSARELVSNYNLLTMPTPAHRLEMTSSWFAWSENIETCLDCSYCIIKQIEYLKKMRVTIGVQPTRLPEIVDRGGSNDATAVVGGMRKTKLPTNDGELHRYGDVRVEKPCRIPLYPPAGRDPRPEP